MRLFFPNVSKCTLNYLLCTTLAIFHRFGYVGVSLFIKFNVFISLEFFFPLTHIIWECVFSFQVFGSFPVICF